MMLLVPAGACWRFSSAIRAAVSTLTVQVFISYARDDDVAPPGRDEAKGVVTYLDEQLRYELTQLRPPHNRARQQSVAGERGGGRLLLAVRRHAVAQLAGPAMVPPRTGIVPP